jgi:catechol 2,3-dioxygenase-like lactoylglutathione lyase family enzyme
MHPHISIVTLGVADLAASIRFYGEGLGLERRGEEEGIAFFEMGSVMLGLYPREALAEDAEVPAEGSGFRGFTIAHNLGSPAAVDAMLAEAVAAGAKLVKPGQEVFWGGYSGYFADPDGFLWEVAHNPFMPELAGGE